MKCCSCIAVLFSVMLFSGCATMSEQDCRGGDWHQVGLRDGSSGYSVERLASHENACRKYDLSSDKTAYFRGHKEGIRRFCTADNGYDAGIDQRAYNYVCPPELERPFLREYAKGLTDRVYQLDYDYREVQERLERARYVYSHSKNEKDRERAYYIIKQRQNELREISNQRHQLNSWLRGALDRL